MTKAAKHFGKRLQHFFDNDATGEYAVALHRVLAGINRDSGDWSVMEYLDAHSFLITVKRGGRKGEAGTWCHPKLAIFFARWLDVRFAVWWPRRSPTAAPVHSPESLAGQRSTRI